ncbi:meiosis-specific kinetochore protein [Rhynochetos jubatus]
MERPRGQGPSWVDRAPQKRRRASPLPEAAAAPGWARVYQPCRRRLFCSAGTRGPEPGSLKSSIKTLPKIQENLDVPKVSRSCNQSNQGNVKEATDLEKKEEKVEESTAALKESLIIKFESKDSLKNAEVTSSTGMTLPTGVSTFLLECLDADSTVDYNTRASDSLTSSPSPETFRDDDSERSNFYFEDSGKYKNSTLLDSSKAVTIDKMPQIADLSEILEPVLAGFQDGHSRRKKPSDCSYRSSALSVSTTVAGKKVCKITAARERTPDLKTVMRSSSSLGPERKPDKQTAKPKGLTCKKKDTDSDALEGDAASRRQRDSLGNASARAVELTARVLPSKRRDAVVTSSTTRVMEEKKTLKNLGDAQPAQLDLSLSPVRKASPGEGLFLNTTGPYVNSGDRVPAALSAEQEVFPQSPEEKNIFQSLCGRQETCSIVRTSPHRWPSRLRQIPVNTKPFCLPRGVPEDIITSTKNWIYCKHR